MDRVKRQTIISEIERWRTSKLLPEHYCDFLLNLYIEEQLDAKGKATHSSVSKLRIMGRSLLIISAICLILVLSLYFTSFHPAMQTGLALIVIGVLYGIGIAKRDHSPNASFALIGAASLMLLFMSEFILRINDWNNALLVMATIAFCGMLWVLIGWLARIGLLHFCGWACLILAYTWLLQWLHPEPVWYVYQLYVIPVFVILFMLGRSQYTTNQKNGLLYVSIASLFFIIPEVYSLIFLSFFSKPIMITVLVCKIVGVLLLGWYTLRKPKVKEWVTDI